MSRKNVPERGSIKIAMLSGEAQITKGINLDIKIRPDEVSLCR